MVHDLPMAEARTFDASADAVGTAYPAVLAADCRGFFHKGGYNLRQPL